MPKYPPGLSLTSRGDNFVIRRTGPAGKSIALSLSAQEVLGLRETISLWSDRIVSQRRAGSGQVEPIIAHPVAQVRVLPDALEANILVTAVVPSGEQITLSLPPEIAEYLAGEIPSILAKMRAGKPRRQ